MKDEFGFYYWLNEAKEWYIMATQAKQRGYHTLAALFESYGHIATNKQQECI